MRYFAVLILLLTGISLQAQDRLFSQTYASPQLLNPALTGAFDGKYRVSGVYRNQHNGALDDPFETYSVATDFKFTVNRNRRKKDLVGIGLVFFTDKVGPTDFSTTSIAVSGAFHKALDPTSDQYLSGGFSMGIVQRNLNYGSITFQDQFDGTNGFFNPTAEDLPENNFAFGDFSAGLNYAWTPAPRTSLFIGLGVHHVFTSPISFFGRVDELGIYSDDPLDQKFSLQLSGSLPLGDQLTVMPRVIGALQGPHTRIDAGTNFRIAIGEMRTFSLHVGGYVRATTNNTDFPEGGNISQSAFEIPTAVTMVGIEYSNILFGFSYDIFLEDVGIGQNAFEISVAYLGEYEDDLLLCPKF